MANNNASWVALALVAIAIGPVTMVFAGGGAGDISVWATAALVFLVVGWLFLRSLPRA
jgi:hypothetical protein